LNTYRDACFGNFGSNLLTPQIFVSLWVIQRYFVKFSWKHNLHMYVKKGRNRRYTVTVDFDSSKLCFQTLGDIRGNVNAENEIGWYAMLSE